MYRYIQIYAYIQDIYCILNVIKIYFLVKYNMKFVSVCVVCVNFVIKFKNNFYNL